MCRAIDAAYEVDEVKDIRDRAAALEHYSRQAHNIEAERQCCEIRLRAERKAGELLRQTEKAKASPGNQHTGPIERRDGSKTLADLGITRDQSSQWQRLAAGAAKRQERHRAVVSAAPRASRATRASAGPIERVQSGPV